MELTRTEEWPPTFTAEDGTFIVLTLDEYTELGKPEQIDVTVKAVKSKKEKADA